ncbi:SGNH/GDSL hydrolase family protein [Siccirubricoccus deserti]|uniref:SGNH/GDSL hydrolase family protein n=3 Tax=Siccirubricoccus deserti TaxID=2013562 RepID=A0A9X0R5U6_9PROT|nr:SGNH/GDSL hydrolase family protein [Siccirubricoccus deserti]
MASLAATRAEARVSAGYIVLLGDSVFDNAAFVDEGREVVAQLRGALSTSGWRAMLAARGGAMVEDVSRQLARLPGDATHLIVSVGGNDALRAEAMLAEPARSVAEALARLDILRERFRRTYRTMLDAVCAHGLPVAVCTIYDPRFPDAARQRLAVAGLTLFNDAILREAFARDLAVIDLRLICSDPADFANAIEPSALGGAKIAAEIVAMVTAGPVAQRGFRVFAGRQRRP